jgi:hypothetical protein
MCPPILAAHIKYKAPLSLSLCAANKILSSGTLLTAAIKTTSAPSEHDEMFLVHIRQKEMLGQHFVGVSLRGALQKSSLSFALLSKISPALQIEPVVPALFLAEGELFCV